MLSIWTPTFLDELGHTPLATGPLPQLLRAALLRSLEPSNPLWAATHWVKVPCRTHEHNPGSAKIRSLGSGPCPHGGGPGPMAPLSGSPCPHPSQEQEIKPPGRAKRLCRQAAGTEWGLDIAQLLPTEACPGRSYAGDSLWPPRGQGGGARLSLLGPQALTGPQGCKGHQALSPH